MRNSTEKGSTVAISIYDQFVPVFSHMLSALDKVLSKAEADAAARKIDLDVFVNGRLAPDMLPLARQIQILTDQAKGCASRLAGQDPPKWADDEKTFADLHARVAKTIAHLKTFKPEQFEGAEKRAIEIKFPNATFNFTGKDYLLNFVTPNFYFHTPLPTDRAITASIGRRLLGQSMNRTGEASLRASPAMTPKKDAWNIGTSAAPA
jgi:hypothetical protein